MITPNVGQQFVIDQAVDWFYNSGRLVFQYTGGPGSGKSFVLMEIIKRLGLNPITEVAAMSFMGSASLVMRNKGLLSARTAHSWIYFPVIVDKRDKDGNIVYDKLLNTPVKIAIFKPIESLPPTIKLIAIDEAGSMPMNLKKDIEKFGIKIIACGDPDQLPPVGDAPAYLTDGKIYRLTECMRQAGLNDIQFICNQVRQGIPLINGYYGNSMVINNKDVSDNMLMWADMVICGRNSTRDIINKRIRNILGYSSDLPMHGEKVVCRQNNWGVSVDMGMGMNVNLVNGLTGTVSNNPDVSTLDGQMFTMDFVPDLAPGIMFQGLRCNYLHMISDNAMRLSIRQNKFSVGDMFEYGYAITSHISQGSQFHKVLYIEERMPPDIQRQINLVGASRADQALIYAKPY